MIAVSQTSHTVASQTCRAGAVTSTAQPQSFPLPCAPPRVSTSLSTQGAAGKSHFTPVHLLSAFFSPALGSTPHLHDPEHGEQCCQYLVCSPDKHGDKTPTPELSWV